MACIAAWHDMGKENLIIKNAKANNLKSVSLEIPHDAFVVVTGLSGSGKSSLAFDTVYAEGQRRYIETFSPYTRQFLDKVKKPEADHMENVRPAIAIQQRTRVTNSRSTVGSITNINDYLKVIWSNLAQPFCPNCQVELKSWSAPELCVHITKLQSLLQSRNLLICCPISIENKKALKKELMRLSVLGFSRYFNTESLEVESLEGQSNPKLSTESKLIVVIDRLRPGNTDQKRLKESIEQAFSLSASSSELKDSACLVIDGESKLENKFLQVINCPDQLNVRSLKCRNYLFRASLACPYASLTIDKPRPALFSFNHPYGACIACKGFGRILEPDEKLCVPNPNLSLAAKAIQCWSGPGTKTEFRDLLEFCKTNKINTKIPWKDLPKQERDLIFKHKSKDYWGVIPWFKWLEKKTYKVHVRVFLSKYRSAFNCTVCNGTRLKPAALAYKILGKTIADISNLPISSLLTWIRQLYQANQSKFFELNDVFSALIARLEYLHDLGLSYLTLERQARTLSGGETQRVNLASALGSELISTHFVLDEPSVGLHARDTERLVAAIKKLNNRGNSLLVVEHDLDCIAQADHIIEMGPLSGELGGEVVFNNKSTNWPGFKLTLVHSKYDHKDFAKAKKLKIFKASARNLKGFDLEIPLNSFVVLSGVSGSGKSTLVNEVINKAYTEHKLSLESSCKHNLVQGFENLDEVILVDQSPLAKSPRANIGTYTGIWDRVRDILASSDDAITRALGKSAFSFNVEGGRCPACKGAGFIKEDMQFLSDVYLQCEVCLGRRFQAAVLETKYKGHNAADFLDMTVSRALEFFHNQQNISAICNILDELGLGHLRLGHSLSELSGGEAQRLKLVPFLERSTRENSLLIFDEPTTGLHQHDIEKLLRLFRLLVQKGNSIICIEHNLSVIACADWIIDLGPEGGELGGHLLKQGTSKDFLETGGKSKSYTAHFLRTFLQTNDHLAYGKKKRLIETSFKPQARLQIKGAKEHNLKNLDIDVPLNCIVGLTGVSGSGKSSIAKDIIYAEGQRRYLDCLSPYARQYIKELKKPEIEEITNVKPTICVYQHTFQPGQLSTVATMSEVYNFLRLLYSKAAIQFCPDHPEQRISPLSSSQIAKELKGFTTKSIKILAPIIKQKKGNHKAILQRALDSEISQIRIDGVLFSPGSFNIAGGLERNKAHSIDYVVSKFNPANMDTDLIEEGIKQALGLSGGTLIALIEGVGEKIFSIERTCPVCKQGFFRPDPEDLSFNSKRGACPTCQGTGLNPSGDLCHSCLGTRINRTACNLRLNGKNIHEVCMLNAKQLTSFLKEILLDDRTKALGDSVLSELFAKLKCLEAIGLDYLELSRSCHTLSSGELQRLRHASAMGSPLSGVMYIFDEPSAGLHPQDNSKVLSMISELKDRGNSVIVIEHEAQSILHCDHIIDIGPGAGKHGGEVVFNGALSEFLACTNSLTAQLLSKPLPLDTKRAAEKQDYLSIIKAKRNNIKALSAKIPLASLVAIVGVSGAGKSTLVNSIISETLSSAERPSKEWQYENNIITSTLEISRVKTVDQKPIGINSRSTPASYLGIWDEIRKLFAMSNEAKARGWKNSFFSYNTGKGRCIECKGLGQIKLEMSFLPDAQILCEVCAGKRFSDEALTVTYLGLNISDVLNLTFEEAKHKFANHRKIHQILHQACELGLGYLTLGQSSTTLSGGESQRIKLISELSSSVKGHTIYILDEPTTGLHKADVAKLVKTLQSLVSKGNTVLVIEHDLDVILQADYVLELGPGPAAQGGKIIFEGAPATLVNSNTPWGAILAETLNCFEKSAGT